MNPDIAISEAESVVMDILWRAHPASADEVIAALAGQQDWQEATIKTLLNRLLNKGAIKADKDGRRYLYSPLLQREQWLSQESESLLERLFGGRVAPLVPPELELANFELGAADLDKQFPTVDVAGTPPTLTLRAIIERLEETYCRSIGVEFTHVEDPSQRTWLQRRMESTKNRIELDPDRQLRILTKLSDAEIFEQFIHRSYEAGTKRFSLEGGEALIPLLDQLIERAGDDGVAEIVFGMAHR